MLPRMRFAVLARSLAGRVLDPHQEAFNKGFSLRKVNRLGSCGKLPKSEDECSKTLLQSKIEKKINEQNVRVTNLTNEKNLILLKLKKEVSFYKVRQDTQLERLRVLGNDMLFKYMEQSVKFVVYGAAVSSLLLFMYNKYNFGPDLKDFFGKVPCCTSTAGGASNSNSSDVNK